MNTIFKALNDPTRREILKLLQEKEKQLQNEFQLKQREWE